jgi:hypothetical protein
MVYRFLFPRGGGGFIRRYKNFQQQIFQRSWETPDVHPYAPVTLFDFTRPDDAADILSQKDKASTLTSTLRQRDSWRVSDDRVIGGYSDSFAHLIRPSIVPDTTEDTATTAKETGTGMSSSGTEYHSNVDEEEDEKELQRDAQDEANATAKRPFIRWYGNLDTTIGLESTVQRSGFAALRSPSFLRGANLRGAFTALEITCRTDGRVYTINLQVETSLPEDMYQGHIDVPATPPGRWDRLYVPFSEFGFLGALKAGGPRPIRRQTRQGDDNDRMLVPGEENDLLQQRDEEMRQRQDAFRRRMAQQRTLEIGADDDFNPHLDNNICIESIGFALMDGQNGPFVRID